MCECGADHADSDTHTQRERENTEHTRSVCESVRAVEPLGQRRMPKAHCQRSKAEVMGERQLSSVEGRSNVEAQEQHGRHIGAAWDGIGGLEIFHTPPVRMRGPPRRGLLRLAGFPGFFTCGGIAGQVWL